MTPSPLDKASNLLQIAQDRLDAAILAGDGIESARERLLQAADHLLEVRAQLLAQGASDPATEREQAEAAATLAQLATAGAQARLTAYLPAPPRRIDPPVSLALALVTAGAADREAASRLGEWEAEADRRQRRIHAEMERRQEIITRQAAGDRDPGDAATLALTDEVIGRLRVLLAEHLATKPQAHDQTGHALRGWEASCKSAEQAVLRDYAVELQAALVACCEALASAASTDTSKRLKIDPRLARAGMRGVY